MNKNELWIRVLSGSDKGARYQIKFVRVDKPDGLYDGGIIWQLVTNDSWDLRVYRQCFTQSFYNFLELNEMELIEGEELQLLTEIKEVD